MSQVDDGQAPADFLSHDEIAIQAPADAVWQAVLNPSDWHGTRMVHVGGPAGEVGERFDVTSHEDHDAVMLRIENVELDPARRRTMRIHTPDGAFTGYSSWTLQDRGGETSVAYDVFCRYPFPKEMTPEQIQAAARQGNAEGLRRLKAFVETGERP